MKDLIKLEYRKLWNGVSVVSIAALSVITVLLAAVTLNIQYRTIDKNGNLVKGLRSFRALKDAAKDLEGVMDGEYLKNLVEDYDNSFDKAYLDEHRGFLGTGGMTKYIISNYLINYAYYGPYMSNGNDKIGLDYDFLNSEESFYQKYKEALMEQLLYMNEVNGFFPYSEEQTAVLDEKVQKLKTPFTVAYSKGFAHVNNYFGMEYPVFFVLLVFCLASVYAKDSINGVDELSLSSKYGRKKNMRARWAAGNLFTVTAYLIFVGTLIMVHGIIGSLHGFGASAQNFWFDCLYSISFGCGLMFIFLGGLAGALVMGNIAMLLSAMIKNFKVSAAAGIVVVWLFGKASNTYSQIKLLNPKTFGTNTAVTGFVFVGKIFIPYLIIIIFLSIVYIAILRFAMKIAWRKRKY